MFAVGTAFDFGAVFMTLANPVLAILKRTNPILVNPFLELVCVTVGPGRVGPRRRWGPNPEKVEPRRVGA